MPVVENLLFWKHGSEIWNVRRRDIDFLKQQMWPLQMFVPFEGG